MDNKRKGNLAVASAIKHFVSAGYTVSIPLMDTAKYDLVVERGSIFQAVQCKYVGRESKWSKWERYLLSNAGDDCSPTEESVGDNSSNSVKPV
jgi:hypothetical protein